MAAKLQKEKDKKEAEQKMKKQPSYDEPSAVELSIRSEKPREDKSERHVKIVTAGDMKIDTRDEEKRHLQVISDRIDECLERAQRLENYWESNIQNILRLLGHDPEMDLEKRSYV